MSEEGFWGVRLHDGKLSDGARRASGENNRGNVERKVKVFVVVDYCEMSLMRESVAFKSIILRGTVNTILYMYCPVHDNIGLNLFT